MTTLDDEFWADFLGVAATDWAERGVSVHSHAGLSGYRGLWCFRRGERFVLSVPASWVRWIEDLVEGRSGAELMSTSFWERALSGAFERAVGPAFQGRLDPVAFRPTSDPSVRALRDADDDALERFRSSCGAEWNMPDEAVSWRHASFDERAEITAMAGYRSWSDRAGDPCVISRPDARGRGLGAAVTSAVVVQALAARKQLLYQTLESNVPAVRIALSLGYERYANHLAIRLTRDAPVDAA